MMRANFLYRLLAKIFHYLVMKETSKCDPEKIPINHDNILTEDTCIKKNTDTKSYSRAFTLGPLSLPFTSSGKLISGPIARRELILLAMTFQEIGFLRFLYNYVIMTLGLDEDHESYQSCSSAVYFIPRIYSLEYEPHYGHWMGEVLPQIMDLRKLRYRPISILTNLNRPAWQRQAMKKFLENIEHNILTQGKDNVALRWNELIVLKLCNIHSRAFEADPIRRKWIAKYLSHNAEPNVKMRRVFIGRQLQSTRRIRNFSEVVDVLKQYDFEFFETTQSGFNDDVQYFRDVEAIIGPFGSNLIKMFFAPNLKFIFEIKTERYNTKKVWEAMASDLSVKHSEIKAEEIGCDDREWDVNIESLRRELSRVGF